MKQNIPPISSQFQMHAFATQVVPDKLVDPTVEENKNIPTTQQKTS